MERLLPDHALDRMPLIQAIFVLQNMPSSSTELPELQIRPFIDAEPATAKFDLAVFMHTGSQGLSGIVNYNSDLFERDSIATMMGRFEALLHHIVSHPEMAIGVLDFYTDAEKTRRIEQKNKSLRKLKFARGGEVHLP